MEGTADSSEDTPHSDTPGAGSSARQEPATSGTGANEDGAKDGKGADTSNINVANLAVAAIGVITAAAALIGGFTGGIARVARNGPGELPWDVALVFLAALAALIAALIPRPESVPKRPEGPAEGTDRGGRTVLRGALLGVALVLFGVASFKVAQALSYSLAKPDRPIINATWVSMDGGWVLKGSVKASGLKTTDKMTVVVSRLVATRSQAPPRLFTKPGDSTRPTFKPAPHFVYYAGTVYKQVVGADLNGNAAISLQVPLPKHYDGLQVSANLGDEKQCPLADKQFNRAQLSCLILDAPSWSAPTK
jgi:hypothetical protein